MRLTAIIYIFKKISIRLNVKSLFGICVIFLRGLRGRWGLGPTELRPYSDYSWRTWGMNTHKLEFGCWPSPGLSFLVSTSWNKKHQFRFITWSHLLQTSHPTQACRESHVSKQTPWRTSELHLLSHFAPTLPEQPSLSHPSKHSPNYLLPPPGRLPWLPLPITTCFRLAPSLQRNSKKEELKR